MFDFILKNPMVRAYMLAAARHGATFVSGLLLAWLLKHGVDATDAQGLAQDVSGLVIFAASIACSMFDVKQVDRQVASAQMQGAAVVATGLANGSASPLQISAASGSPRALAQLVAKLKAGQQ